MQKENVTTCEAAINDINIIRVYMMGGANSSMCPDWCVYNQLKTASIRKHQELLQHLNIHTLVHP